MLLLLLLLALFQAVGLGGRRTARLLQGALQFLHLAAGALAARAEAQGGGALVVGERERVPLRVHLRRAAHALHTLGEALPPQELLPHRRVAALEQLLRRRQLHWTRLFVPLLHFFLRRRRRRRRRRRHHQRGRLLVRRRRHAARARARSLSPICPSTDVRRHGRCGSACVHCRTAAARAATK
eukprot:scaffold3068_cov401-Prasinococcus_capsulatus_cf.AAC.47